MASHRWLAESRDPENKGVIAAIHPWETGRDNCPDWDMGLKTLRSQKELESYARRDIMHVENQQRPTKQEYDKYIR